jgi:hypothetical protein
MELEIALIAVVMAVAALWMAMGQRSQVSRLVAEAKRMRQEIVDLRSDLAASEQRLAATEGRLTSAEERAATTAQRLTELTEAAPTPPLPRARSADLDDLRAQLRAAHREGDDADEE